MSLKSKKVIIAMSGGVDSSVAAALFKKSGFSVTGVFMRFWKDPATKGGLNRCCSPEAEQRARQVASLLGIPFYVFNLQEEFKKKVVDSFLAEYRKGRTPNPCVVCNKEIKFGLLLEKALALGADFVATGHYACLRQEIPSTKSQIPNKPQIQNPKHKIFKARDRTRDQSYFLWQLSQKQLKHILFPLSDLTKDEVRRLAKKFNLPVSDIPESREICFITTTVNDFLAKHLRQKPGQIVDTEGKIIGQHQGLAFYTIGQRRGLGLPGGKIYYVLDKAAKRNLLILTQKEKDLYKRELIVENVNWISGKAPELPLRVKARIRYKHKEAAATVTERLKEATLKIVFKIAQKAITPGQSVVFYSAAEASARTGKDQELLGGGIIA